MKRLGGFVGPGIAVIFPYFLFEMIRNSPYDTQYNTPVFHFYIVTIVALLASVVGIAVGAAGNRLRNIKVSFLSLSFLSLAGILVLHGLTTPGLLIQEPNLSGILAQLSVLLATFWLWLSSLPADKRFIEYISQWKTQLVFAWTAILCGLGIGVMMFPELSSYIPLNQDPIEGVLIGMILVLNLFTMYSYYQSYRYSKFPLQISIVYSAGWFIVAQLIMVIGVKWWASWWMYHFLLLASMVAMLVGLVRQYAARRSVIGAIQALFTTDPVERITNSISPSVKALILATESKDKYTAGHNFRVTMYSLRIAEEMKLQPEQLRALVQGAIIHDVGKIKIPDTILNKPGKLTEEERTFIQMHPVTGYEMCKNLGFMREELAVIRSHHERWDGTGYPDRLRGTEIPIAARIVAVADVYDALTSNRSYRQAWTHEETIRFLIGQRGSQFDPGCVEAWVRVCERDPEVYQYPWTFTEEEVAFPLRIPSKTTTLGG